MNIIDYTLLLNVFTVTVRIKNDCDETGLIIDPPLIEQCCNIYSEEEEGLDKANTDILS